MKTIYLFSKEEQEQLLREFCQVNRYSYHMVCEIMFKNLLGEKSAKDFMTFFQYFISGKLGIHHEDIKFELED